jgi:hypothetical protein
MATVDITEYQNLAMDGFGVRVAAGFEPSRGVRQIAVSASSSQSVALDPTTKFVRVHTDTTIRIAFGADPTAGPTSQRMPANSTEYYGVTPGIKIAAIASS